MEILPYPEQSKIVISKSPISVDSPSTEDEPGQKDTLASSKKDRNVSRTVPPLASGCLSLLLFLLLVVYPPPLPLAVHAQTLPEQLTTDNIMDFIETNSITTVAELIEALPVLHKRHVGFVYESEAPNNEYVSGDYPRVISWGADSRFVLSWSTDPDMPDNERVEFLHPGSGRWVAGMIDFSGQTPEISNPGKCADCHGSLNKPLWGQYPTWKGTEDEHFVNKNSQQVIDYTKAIVTSDHERLEPLDLRQISQGKNNRFITVYDDTHPVNATDNLYPLRDFGSTLAWRHGEVLFEIVKEKENYMEIAREAVCEDPESHGAVTLIKLFTPEEYHPALRKNIETETDPDTGIETTTTTFEPIQGSSVPDDTDYETDNGRVGSALLFLILHDLYESDTQVRELYQNLQNTETVSILGFLHYYPCPPSPENARYTCPENREPTAEDELLKKYDQHFGLKGLAALHERNIQWARSLDKGATFGLGHTEKMAPEVCDILTPKITLVLDPDSINENGGKSTIKATLNRPSSEETTIDVSAMEGDPPVPADSIIPNKYTLTIPPNETESTETVTTTGVNNDVSRVNRSVTMSATVTNSQGVITPLDVMLEIIDSYVAPPPPPPPPPSLEDNEMPENIEETETDPQSSADDEESLKETETSPQSSADDEESLKIPTSGSGCTIASSEDKKASTIRDIVFNFSLTVAVLLLVLIPTASISPMRNRG